MQVIVLNADYTYLHTISWKRGIKLVLKGKVEVLKYAEKAVRGINETVVVPLIVRLITFVRRVYRSMVPMSRRNVFIRDEFTCQYCGRSCRKSPTLDHIIPRSRGGTNAWENSVTACSRCNQRKGSKTPSEARMRLKRQPVRPTINEFAQKKMKVMGVQAMLQELFNAQV